MSRRRPEALAVRAVNQYRRRDVLPYLALRYYLENEAARSDSWANHVATDLVLTRTDSPYLRAWHFKGLSESGQVQHREIYLPGANEALAEAALLGECARHLEQFGNPKFVHSYALTDGADRSGVFTHYVTGLQSRHAAIAQACVSQPQGIVRYLDIRSFYPSVQRDLALSAWRKGADEAKLASPWRALGEKLIEDHSKATEGCQGCILTGPMFSHFLGNLVLRQLDQDFASSLPAAYVRYVDDITLIGSEAAVNASVAKVRARLLELGGFQTHGDSSPKSLSVPASEWILARHDFAPSKRGISWMTLVGDLKRFLLVRGDDQQQLHDAFVNEGFRIPIMDYSNAIFERSYLDRLRYWARAKWFREKTDNITMGSLLMQANWLRGSIQSEFEQLVSDFATATAFDRKRMLPKLRYRAGRLAYLATDEVLAKSASLASEVPDLYLHAAVMAGVSSGQVDQVLGLGGNAAQAIAQPMKAGGKRARMTLSDLRDAEYQSLAVLRLNGVKWTGMSEDDVNGSELLALSEVGGTINLMKSRDSFIREIACLHGISVSPETSGHARKCFR